MDIIAGDIGGTKSWLAWAQQQAGNTRVLFEHVYASADFPSAEALLEQFVADAGQVAPAASVCLALPGPVQAGKPIRLTNLDWTLETSSLQALLNTPRLLFINDFQAAAAGISTLQTTDYVVLNAGETPHPNPSPSRGEGLRDSFLAPPRPLRERGLGGEGFPTRVITGAGTGLGLAWMQADAAGHYHTFATEGGHTDFAPANAQQERLLAFARQRHAHVSWERLVSGPGVNLVWQFCWQDMSGDIPLAVRDYNGAVVNQAAQAGDAVAIAAMQLFTDLYANWVGNLALLYQPRGGLYLGGGISARIQPWLQEQRFLNACCDKGRMSGLVAQMPIYLVTNTRLGLQGAMAVAMHHTME